MVCGSMFKTLLWITNFVLFAAGAFLIGAGIYVWSEMKEFLEFFDERYSNGAILLGVCGLILFVIGFLGCCGAQKESQCMLYTFAALLSLIVIAEVAGAIYVFAVNPAGSKEKIGEKMKEAQKNYGKDGYEGVTIAWNLAQNKLKCCGVTSSADWPRTPPPPSCYEDATCDSDFKTCKRGQSGGDIYPPLGSNGCLTKMEAFVNSNMNLVGGIGIGIALLQILGIIIACKIPKDFQYA